jgi:molecular chaperone GrpE
VNDQATPNEDTLDDLSTPELLAGDGEQDEGEVIELTPEDGEGVVVFPSPIIEIPEDPAEAVPVLVSALTQSHAEAMGYLETVQRVAAEFDNFRKRSARERDDIVDRASLRLIERLLPTLDSFTAALGYEAQTEAEAKILAGMADTHRLLMEALAVDGLEPIDADGAPFDPAVHEAVTGPDGAGDGDLIVSEMRRGYTLRGRVVRAALVAVRHA